MASPENRPARESKIEMPFLIAPYSGVFKEVRRAYLDDREKFEGSSLTKMEFQNPNLLPIFDDANKHSANDYLTYKWMFIYYEIFARSAQERGFPPMQVSERVAKADQKLILLKYKTAARSAMEGDPKPMDKLQREEWERRLRDEALSEELVAFWQSVDEDIALERDFGADESTVQSILTPLVDLQEILQRQEDEYTILQEQIEKGFDIIF